MKSLIILPSGTALSIFKAAQECFNLVNDKAIPRKAEEEEEREMSILGRKERQW